MPKPRCAACAAKAELDQLLAEREKINTHLQSIIDQHTEPWGIKVVQVAIKFIDLPEEMRRVMAHQAEAERERRALALGQSRQGLGRALLPPLLARLDDRLRRLPADVHRGSLNQ